MFFIENKEHLGYDSENNPSGCQIWKDTESEIYDSLNAYRIEANTNYKPAIENFEPIPDLLKAIIVDGNHDVCKMTKPHPEGLSALFPSGGLSLTKSGFVEPLFPPMRSVEFCFERYTAMRLEYLVHDFEAMCHKLKPHSKRILIDLGASLTFGRRVQPVITLMKLYEKFGFNFDHVFAFEYKFTEPEKVYKDLLPTKYFKSYHWINVGVESEITSKMNPLESILKQFDEDDFIVLKLDIDTPDIELPLAKQILEDKDGQFHKLIDQFYFEHHVHMKELAHAWKHTMNGTIAQSLDLFHTLRENGIPAHFWV